ncbi:hypothetical protein M3D63_09535 [Kocuria palustris]|uniref:hypothetical protein n=1 Tax=Kocuria palustris TaxID=71999 RepID=UPI000A461752|nr:hypothetical protein [Kocuria palustris]MCT1835012.1 hypothetical protein [Kocuria palustris]
MSALTRLAVLAAGAAVGAGAGRAVGSDRGRRALAQAVERGRGAVEPADQGLEVPVRENRLGTRVLRVVQDIRSGMDQAETELRDQLGGSGAGSRREAAAERLSGRAAAELQPGPRADEQTIIEHDDHATVESSRGGS